MISTFGKGIVVSSASLSPSAGRVLLDPSRQVIEITPGQGWPRLDLAGLWHGRELLYFLTWRDLKVRYKQTVLGIAWAVLQPLSTMVVFTLFFGKLAGIPSDGIPYPIFTYAALLPWMFFSNGVSTASNCMVGHANLLTKIYFPRLLVPLATVISNLIDFALAFVVLLVLMAWYGIAPAWTCLLLPIPVALAVVTALGVGLWLAALNVQFRDVRYTVPFLCQLWMFASPIAYPASLVTGPWKIVYAVNPITGVVETFRWALLGTDTAPGPMFLVSTLVSLALLVSGAMYFRTMERTFADHV